ncbi:hypothetical protein [Glycomyces tenuis]|uniref:hypothetical protein n=1 Tax=Glycomyces tenuis TaxID=58116 RepID=UPI0012DDE94C|nr:hypothetical protein [Glycomyces tenuis]
MNRMWRLLIWGGIAFTVVTVIAAAISYAMDDTYPAEMPGWLFPLFWTGVAIAVLSAVVRGILEGFKNQ